MPDRMQRGPDEPTDDRIKDLANALLEALLAGDEVGAEITVREAMDAELSTAEIDEEMIGPALWLVGELWERGKISVAEEHLATEIALRVLALQRDAADGRLRRRGARADRRGAPSSRRARLQSRFRGGRGRRRDGQAVELELIWRRVCQGAG